MRKSFFFPSVALWCYGGRRKIPKRKYLLSFHFPVYNHGWNELNGCVGTKISEHIFVKDILWYYILFAFVKRSLLYFCFWKHETIYDVFRLMNIVYERFRRHQEREKKMNPHKIIFAKTLLIRNFFTTIFFSSCPLKWEMR